MKIKPSQLLFSLFFTMMILWVAVMSCNKKFDEPPAYIPPAIAATTTIGNIRSAHLSGNIDSFANDAIIGGVVIANDSSGNFYKQIIIEDSTGGIAVNIDDYNLYTSFPIGRKIYVNLKGLYLADNGGLPFLGASPDNSGAVANIASQLLDRFIVKGETNMPITPAKVSVNDVKNNPNKYAYTLVEFANFEVKESDTLQTYATSTPTVKASASITAQGCGGSDTMVIRTSGYAYFANAMVPKGNGTLTGVYAYYKSPYNGKIYPQVILRDTSDVQFSDPRCNSVSQPVTPIVTTIKNIRALYKSAPVVLGNYQIGGVVISDAVSKNISSGSVVLQDGDHGISVYFGTPVFYNAGDSIVLDLTGDTLLNYNGSLEIKMIKNTVLPTPVATNKMISPNEVSIQQLNNSLTDIEYTLVKIKSATASGASTFSGNQTLTDAAGSIAFYTSPTAVFASSSLPTTVNDWVGYGSFYNKTPQFQIRNTNDIVGDTSTAQSTVSDLLISEYIEGSSGNKYLEIYNAAATAADLTKYSIKRYTNGATTASSQALLDTLFGNAVLPAGGFIIIQYPSATLPLPSGVVAHKSSVCNFNGDDAIAIEKNGTVIDVFGSIGIDPGAGWTIAGIANASANHSVKRKASITSGNTNWSSSSAYEWMVGALDDVSNLGTR